MLYIFIMSHRTLLTLTDSQYLRLKDESDRTGLELAALVRRALAVAYGDLVRSDSLHVLEATFGAWQDRALDGETSVERLRPGMAHRLAR